MNASRDGGGCSTDTASAPEDRLTLGEGPDAVRTGRHFVEQTVTRRGAGAVADDAGLVAGELLANAQEHGQPPVVVSVRVLADIVRIEVSDGSGRAPVRTVSSTTNMTGRGLNIVEALALRWGIDHAGAGKTIWVELGRSAAVLEPTDGDIDAILAAWSDEEPDVAAKRHAVVLGDVPTDLLIEAKAHVDNLVREFTLAAAGASTGEAEIPEHLAQLIESVVYQFADARDAIKRQALAALHRGDPRTRLTLHLAPTSAAAGEAYLRALDEADEYARAARLLTLETPPDHRLFRRWYVHAVVAQLRAAEAGVAPTPVVPFEDELVAEVRRLSAAQRVSGQAARLQRVTAALARARMPADVAQVVLTEGVDALGASGGGMLLPAGDGEHIAVPGVVGYGSELLDALREERLDAPLPAATAMRTGEPVWLETPEERDRMFPALRGFEASTVAMCAVPLVVGGTTIGALRFSFARRRLFDDDERAFVLALAAQTAQTLHRTEVDEAERRAALGLQRALLPQDLPPVPGWSLASHYSPAGEQEAGGDFYDVLPLADGRVAAMVGDVMGRGVSAAAAMALVRSTLGAYAVDDPDPSSLFARADRFFAARDVQQLVTALYFLIDADGHTVHVANAGHPAPLLVRPGRCEPVAAATGTPLGIDDVPRTVTTVGLQAGEALVAFTDGLVERRNEDIDEAIGRVIAALRTAAPAADATALVGCVLGAGAPGAHDDDVTVLVLLRR